MIEQHYLWINGVPHYWDDIMVEDSEMEALEIREVTVDIISSDPELLAIYDKWYEPCSN